MSNITDKAAKRLRAWNWASQIAAQRDVWLLEAFKRHLELTELQTDIPFGPDAPKRRQPLAQLAFALGAIVGLMFLGTWIVRRRGPSALPTGPRRVVALHGELSTRTRHVLAAIHSASPPVDAIILLGRLRLSAAQVARMWQEAGYKTLPPLIVPSNARSALMAVADVPALFRSGCRAARLSPQRLGWMDWAAIAFRCWHGAIIARWWAAQQIEPGVEVVLGISGTADTVLLERAIRAKGGHSVHAVHGQSVGPNFLGFSDLALFRSKHDAEQMERCGGYGRCAIQPAGGISPRRGASGLVLLTNLAHPMNPDFRRDGIVHELAVLTVVAHAAQRIGSATLPLLWKPHPVIAALPSQQANDLRGRAAALGWEELPTDASAIVEASKAHWVVATPSTVALDLLQAGVLCVMVDPSETLLDTALSVLPRAECDSGKIANALIKIDDNLNHTASFHDSWKKIGPARFTDLTISLS